MGGERSFAATHQGDGVAPIPDLRTLTLERGGSIQSGHWFTSGGRPSKLTADDIEAAKAMLANPVIGVTQIAPSRRARRRRSIDTSRRTNREYPERCRIQLNQADRLGVHARVCSFEIVDKRG